MTLVEGLRILMLEPATAGTVIGSGFWLLYVARLERKRVDRARVVADDPNRSFMRRGFARRTVRYGPMHIEGSISAGRVALIVGFVLALFQLGTIVLNA